MTLPLVVTHRYTYSGPICSPPAQDPIRLVPINYFSDPYPPLALVGQLLMHVHNPRDRRV